MIARDEKVIEGESELDYLYAHRLLKPFNMFYFFTTKDIEDHNLPPTISIKRDGEIVKFCLKKIEGIEVEIWAYLRCPEDHED